jgi:patatin-like phospholipase/acyl hydrolase
MVAVLQKGEAANLLSLDGGGIKGISSLVIIQAIMDKVREIENGNGIKNTDDRLPVDYFHLAGGTSTGGIIALMLFRLGMSPKKAKRAYTEMASGIFKKRVNGVFPDQPLKDAIDKTIEIYAPDVDKPLKGECKLVNNKAKM